MRLRMIGNSQIKNIGLVVGVIFFMSNASVAQLNKANKAFERSNYKEAIDLYKKVLKKEDANVEAVQNIAFACRKLNDYQNAEIYYAKAIEINPTEAANYLYYGQTLKNNKKLNAAKAQFIKYLEKTPTSLVGKLMVRSCNDIAKWEVEEKAFEVSIVENINSKSADFCPLVYKDGIVFVSERGIDLVNEDTEFGSTNSPYLSIFYAGKDKQYRRVKKFSNKINTLYHDGPVSISSDNSMLYFTRVEKKEQGKDYTNRIKIYSATLKGDRWKDITPFTYNSNDYSVAHPWISADGKKLFFASDMSGGEGGMDIYVCEKQAEGWSKPVNLGKGVNTEGNEVFPYFFKDKLYFSSTGHSGYGGLDVYVVEEKNKWENPENLRAPLNSSKDDFGIFFTDDENGYFSSNRDGGVGEDDIYRFKWENIEELTAVSGVLEFEKLPSAGTSINLLDENGDIIQSTITNKDGVFKFDKLTSDNNYMVQIGVEDDSMLEKAELYLTNSKGEKVLIASRLEKGKFSFKALPYDEYNELALIEEDDETALVVSVFGQIYDKLPGDYSEGMEVWVVDDEGNIIGKTTVDEKGKFVFTNLSPDEQYLFMLAEDDKGLNLIVTDESGELLEAAKKRKDGKFAYGDYSEVTLAEEEGEDEDLLVVSVFGQIYDKLPGDYSEGMEVWVVDDEGNIIGKTTVDEKGKFVFTNLSPDEQYLFMLAEDDKGLNLIVTDESGELLETAKKRKDGKFAYGDYSEVTLVEETEGDESLLVVSVFGQIYEKLPGDYSEGMEVWVVDDEGNIIGKTTVDDKGKFVFTNLSPDEQYLFMLAEDDKELNLIVTDESGELLETAKREEDGKFKYTRLDANQNVVTLINEMDEIIKIANNENFVISQVYYGYRSARINELAAKELDKLVLILKKNKYIGVEISSHTDSRGGDTYNLELSQKRAEIVAKYVISKGVGRHQLMAKGYGEEQLINNCVNNVKCTEEEHAKNRRTEFKVVRIDEE